MRTTIRNTLIMIGTQPAGTIKNRWYCARSRAGPGRLLSAQSEGCGRERRQQQEPIARQHYVLLLSGVWGVEGAAAAEHPHKMELLTIYGICIK